MAVTTFVYTGAAQTYTVPSGVTSVVIDAQGASGSPFGSGNGGTGAHVRGTLAVTAGDVLQINVGGGGVTGNGVANGPANPGGWNGGGYSGISTTGGPAGNGGGGASDVRHGGSALSNRVIVGAGGGAGGGGGDGTNPVSGGGGGVLGGNGAAGAGGALAGQGGTQSAGGAGGTTFGYAGVLGDGGAPVGTYPTNAGVAADVAGPGGGGGGYYGGGSGSFQAGSGSTPTGGGGGSSYAGGCTSTSTVAAGTSGGNSASTLNDGYVTITTTDTAPNAPTLTLPVNGGFTDVTNSELGWTFSDPDSGDTQSSADVRYRVAGSTAWTTLASVVTGTLSAYQLTGLTVGVNYEWQVRTYDSQETVGPWSSSSFFVVKLHPVVTVSSPVAGTPITSLASQPMVISAVRDASHYNFRRVGDNNGQPDTTNVIENISFGSAATTSQNFSSTSHNDGPEHWQIQVQTFGGQLISDWVDVFVVMSVDAPTTPTLTATASPSNAAITLQAAFAEGSVDYFGKSSVPSTADTGQALTTGGSTGAVSGGYFTNTAGNSSSQSMTLAGKITAMQCSFRQNALGGSTHTNSIYMVATDASSNAHIYCGIDAQHWYIKLDTAGTLSTLASGTLSTAITTGTLNAYPWSMSATVSGTTVTFVDPFGVVHTATNASVGSFTGHIGEVLINNTAATGDDTWKVAHWSASSTAANIPAYGYLSRSLDGVNFVPIPAAVWDTQELGSVFNYTDYTPPFNRRVWYRATGVTTAGAIANSVVS